MQPQNQSVSDLVTKFIQKELALPEMQRNYVWRSTQVRDLLDSLYRGYPTGSILLWDTGTVPEIKRPSLESKDTSSLRPPLLLLDGQQRITSLATIMTGLPIRVKEGRKVTDKFVEIYFNIKHPEDQLNGEETLEFKVGDHVDAKWEEDGDFYPAIIEKILNDKYWVIFEDGDEDWSDEVRYLSETSKKDLCFQIKYKGIENNKDWISVTRLFSNNVGTILKDLKISHEDASYDLIYKRLNDLYNVKTTYYFPVQVIRNKTYRDVTQIFNRVNSAGTKLRGSDLALAQLTSIWPGSMKILEAFVEECSDQQFYIDANFLVRCMVCLATDQSLFSQIGALRLSKLQDSWKQTKRGIENTINFLKHKGFIDTSSALPSLNLLIPLVVYSASNKLADSKKKSDGFLFWFYNAMLWARYSGSAETKLTHDLASLKKNEPWLHLIESIWQSVGKNRKLTVDDVRAKGSGSPIFSLMYILARSKGAIDYETGQNVAYSNFGSKNKIEFDHIFPQSKLGKKLPEEFESEKKKRLINEVSNLAFLTKEGNIIKTNDDPEEYFPRVIKKYGTNEHLSRQEIPCVLNLFLYPNYEDFLNARANLITDSINKLIFSYQQ
jgi:hypothetical protein